MTKNLIYTDWQRKLMDNIGIETKITLALTDVSLYQDLIPAEINGEQQFVPFKTGFSSLFPGDIIHFNIHGFHSYTESNLENWMQTTTGSSVAFTKTFDDGILPQVKDNNCIYPECANLIRRLFTGFTNHALMIIFDCRGFKECVSPEVFEKISLLFQEMYSAVNTILFITTDGYDIPCKNTYNIAVGFPDYDVRKKFLLQPRFSNIPVIKTDAERFIVISSGFSITTVEKLTRISERQHISNAKDLLEYYTTKKEFDPFSTYDKKMVKQRLNEELSRVKGNDDIKLKITDDIVSLFGGMDCIKKDLGKVPLMYFITGPGGCGKSEIARLIGNVFGTENNVISISLSEYTSSAAVNDLLGSSKGYIGYGDASPFEKLIGNHDINIIIFDEAEKAHPDVTKSLLKFLNDGHLNLRDGKHIDFTRSIIFFTSNLGTNKKRIDEYGQDVIDAYGQPIRDPAFTIDTPESTIKQILIDSVKEYYNAQGIPEFLNRIGQDHILPMCPLSENAVKELVNMLCRDLVTLAKERYSCEIKFTQRGYVKLEELGLRLRSEEGRGITKSFHNLFRTIRNFEPRTKNIVIHYENGNFIFQDENRKTFKKEIIL